MINKKKISIILPIYNTKKCLARCLGALVCQTHKDIEVLCIDDGSTDGSLEVLKKYAEKDDRIKVFTQKNSGPATARNVGLKNATGEYLMFCDSDDWYEPNMCEVMLKTIEKQNVDMVTCSANTIIDDYGNRPKISIKYAEMNNYLGLCIIDDKIKSEPNVLLWNKIFKKEIIDKYGITFPDGLEADDNLFVYLYLAVIKTLYGLDAKLYNYFIRKDSIMYNFYKVKELHKYFDRLFIFKNYYDFLKQQGLFKDNKKIFEYLLVKQFYVTWEGLQQEITLKKAKEVVTALSLKNFDHRFLQDLNKLPTIKLYKKYKNYGYFDFLNGYKIGFFKKLKRTFRCLEYLC